MEKLLDLIGVLDRTWIIEFDYADEDNGSDSIRFSHDGSGTPTYESVLNKVTEFVEEGNPYVELSSVTYYKANEGGVLAGLLNSIIQESKGIPRKK